MQIRRHPQFAQPRPMADLGRAVVARWIRALVLAISCCAVLIACTGTQISAGSQRRANPETMDLQRFLVLPRPPEVAAYTPEEIAAARQIMANLSPASLQAREGARIENANALPWLIGSEAGREFLATDQSRILVRGAPREFCPSAMVESGGESVPDLAARALRSCLEQSPDGCGCEVIAAGSVLLVPQSEMNYATAIAARIRAPSLGIDGFLVAEEAPGDGVLLRDLKGVVGRVERSGDGRVEVRLGPDLIPFEGRSIQVGYRRGRVAERIYATDADGNRVSLLVGFDPNELAELAGAWLAWPRGG